MPHHYTKNTIEASAWCSTCNKMTMHYVWDGRIGRCQNDHPHAVPQKQPEVNQGDLFGATPEAKEGRQ